MTRTLFRQSKYEHSPSVEAYYTHVCPLPNSDINDDQLLFITADIDTSEWDTVINIDAVDVNGISIDIDTAMYTLIGPYTSSKKFGEITPLLEVLEDYILEIYYSGDYFL